MKRAFALAAFLVMGATGACDDDNDRTHVFLAQRFEEARGCLDPTTPIDLVKGGDGALTCAPTCLVLPAPPATDAAKIYVTTMCPPYPDDYDGTGADPSCPAALATFADAPEGCGADDSASDAATE